MSRRIDASVKPAVAASKGGPSAPAARAPSARRPAPRSVEVKDVFSLPESSDANPLWKLTGQTFGNPELKIFTEAPLDALASQGMSELAAAFGNARADGSISTDEAIQIQLKWHGNGGVDDMRIRWLAEQLAAHADALTPVSGDMLRRILADAGGLPGK